MTESSGLQGKLDLIRICLQGVSDKLDMPSLNQHMSIERLAQFTPHEARQCWQIALGSATAFLWLGSQSYGDSVEVTKWCIASSSTACMWWRMHSISNPERSHQAVCKDGLCDHRCTA